MNGVTGCREWEEKVVVHTIELSSRAIFYQQMFTRNLIYSQQEGFKGLINFHTNTLTYMFADKGTKKSVMESLTI